MPDFDLGNALNVGLLVTLIAVFVAGLAAVLGIWMERDKNKPPRYAWALSALIVLATFVSLMQSYLDQREQDQLKDDMARLLSTMDKLAQESDDPALKELVKSELTAQSRQNPGVIDKVAQRVSDEGRDPGEVFGRNLDAADAEKVARKSAVKPRSTPRTEKAEEKPKDGEEDGKQSAGAPTAPTERRVPVVPTASPAAARAGAIDAATAARMNMAAGAQPGAAAAPAPGTPPGTPAVAAPAPTPADAKAPAPGSPEAKAAALQKRKEAAAKGGRRGAPPGAGRGR